MRAFDERATGKRPYAEVIGDPIVQSKSPLIHNFWLAKLGIAADYRAVRVTAETLHEYLDDRRRDPAWRGCNVTMPLKAAILPFAAQLGGEVEQIGAANILLPLSKGRLEARNSDIDGVAVPLSALAKADYPNHVATYVQIIGAGGAAPAAAIGAARAGYGDFDVFVRDPERAKGFAGMIGTPFGTAFSLDKLGPIRNEGDDEHDDQRYSIVLINATPMGMAGYPEVPVDLGRYYSDTIVFEMVYHPLETGLVRQARAHGMRVIDGLQMLVAQAAAAFEMFFGAPAPRHHDAELRALLTS